MTHETSVSGLPELPTPTGPWHSTSDDEGYYTYTADQMHAYAREAVEAALRQSGEVVDLHKAIGRVRARANHPGTLEHHHPSYADGMRAACNMLSNMRIVKSVHVAPKSNAALVDASRRLVELVEGSAGHRFANQGGLRLKDTEAWVAFYCIVKDAERAALATHDAEKAGKENP